jgi:hypothetical protein
LYADFHEKAHSVKADVAAATTVRFGYPYDASIRTLGEPTSCGLVHRMRSAFSAITGAAIFRAVSPERMRGRIEGERIADELREKARDLPDDHTS